MTKIIQSSMNGDYLFCIEEEDIKFCFCCRYKDIIDDDSGLDMECTIDMWSGR